MQPLEILESMDCGSCICAVDGETFPLLWSNPEFERITGYSARELAGRDPWSLHTGICPEAENEMKGLVTRGRSCRGIIQIRRADGVLLWLEVSGFPASDNGDSRLFGTIHDWTADWQQRFGTLTPPQQRWFSLLANGLEVKEAAAVMHVSFGHAYRTSRRILRQLRLANFARLYMLRRF